MKSLEDRAILSTTGTKSVNIINVEEMQRIAIMSNRKGKYI
jgi:hypothetical protein